MPLSRSYVRVLGTPLVQPWSKLRFELMEAAIEGGVPQTEVAKAFGISQGAVWQKVKKERERRQERKMYRQWVQDAAIRREIYANRKNIQDPDFKHDEHKGVWFTWRFRP